jgi:flagellar motor switch protein FliG
VKYIFTSLAICLSSMLSPAHNVAAAERARFESDSVAEARNRISNVLQRYCSDACELINVEASAGAQVVESEDLGFEGVAGDRVSDLKINNFTVDIQVDDRVSTADQDRLGKLIVNSLRSLGSAASVRWSSVAFPQIGVSAEVEDRLKQNLRQRIQDAVQQVIDGYCSSECVLANVGVDGRLASPDETRGVPERELVRDVSGRGVLRILNVDVDVSMDEKLPETNRSKIFNLIKAKTRFASPVNVNVVPVDFPETSNNSAAKDPWGLDRLRQTLQIFRDLAGTKEIITNTTQNSSATNSNSTNNRESSSVERTEARETKESSSLLSKEKMSASEKSIASSSSEKAAETNSASEKNQGIDNQYFIYIMAFLVLLLILGAVFIRFASASRDARVLMDAMPNGQVGKQGQYNGAEPFQGGPSMHQMAGGYTGPVSKDSLSIKMKIEGLREELLKAFVDNPKVARDTFSRMLQEEGVDQTARYVHLFGPMIIFDLMSDPSLQRDLNDLSEFYYKSTFAFSDDQTLELLNNLKTKVTASEIRVMARKRSEQFDFLHHLDASQIFSLILEEKAHIQSIVLTQLDHVRRRNVFDLYAGEARIALMRELCKADAIPKEYLANVAKALHKKVLSRTEFDTEQLRSSDIIIELLEKASLIDQRRLMADLVKTNPDAARLIKLKLVTVEMLPYIRDGHLLEIVMGLERPELLTFLVGAPEHIRDLLLSKAPSELAQSWLEDIEQSSAIEESRYRISEMRILGRIRNLANNGAIRLVDINDRIFAPQHLDEVRRSDGAVEMALSSNSVAA